MIHIIIEPYAIIDPNLRVLASYEKSTMSLPTKHKKNVHRNTNDNTKIDLGIPTLSKIIKIVFVISSGIATKKVQMINTNNMRILTILPLTPCLPSENRLEEF